MRVCIMAIAVLVAGFYLTGRTECAVVGIGYVPARPGDLVEVAVDVSSASAIAGMSVRLEFDTNILTFTGVHGNESLLGPDVVLDSYAPEAGRVNVLVFSSNASPLPGSDKGPVFRASFTVSSSASAGISPLRFTTAGPAYLTSSALADLSGKSVAHTRKAGQVDVRSRVLCDVNSDGLLDGYDLFLLTSEWHDFCEAPVPGADVNWDAIVDDVDLLLFQDAWRKPVDRPSPVE